MIPSLLRSHLLRAGRFSLSVHQLPDGVPAPMHEGRGTISVGRFTDDTESSIVWGEEGDWTSGPLAGIHFQSRTLWTFADDGDVLEVRHLRNGEGHPTRLVRLRPEGDRAMISVEPHVCGDDVYSARLQWDEFQLRVDWNVKSPTDPYARRMIVSPENALR